MTKYRISAHAITGTVLHRCIKRTEADAIALRDMWNRLYPGLYVTIEEFQS